MALEYGFKKLCWNGACTNLCRITQGGIEPDSRQKALEYQEDGVYQRKNGLVQPGGQNTETCMSFSHSFSATKRVPTVEYPLEESDLGPRIFVHHGIPATACVITYSPVLHILAAATLDGRVKVFGDGGFEILLQSSTPVPIQFLQFMSNKALLVSINIKNDIEVWDMKIAGLVGSRRWERKVTALANIENSTFLYVGDESGTVGVLQYEPTKAEILVMTYCITMHQTIGAIRTISDESSLVGILPQPKAEHKRVLLSYKNGFSVLWALQESKILSVCGGTQSQLEVISRTHKLEKSENFGWEISSKDRQDDVKVLNCVCWACSQGSLFAAGYDDGDIWLWSIPQKVWLKASPENGGLKDIEYSCTPLSKIVIGSNISSVSVTMMKWWDSDGSKQGKDGYLCVSGGKESIGHDVLKIFSLHNAISLNSNQFIELPLDGGHIKDVTILHNLSTFPTRPQSILVLMSKGQLYSYNTDLISRLSRHLIDDGFSSPPKAVAINLALVESTVTVAKMVLINRTSDFMEIPRVLKCAFTYQCSEVNDTFLFKGCDKAISLVDANSVASYLYITGHENGSVNFWDLSTPYIFSVCHLESQAKERPDSPHFSENSGVSALDFCSISGFLAVGHKSGLISLYRLNYDWQEMDSKRSIERGEKIQSASLLFIASFNSHQTSINCIVIASKWHRLAAGSDTGIVSIIDLKTYTLLYHGRSFPTVINSGIVSLNFVSVPTSGLGFSFFPWLSAPSKRKKASLVLFVTTKDADMVALDGNTGVCHGSSLKPKNPSRAISLQLLDASGIPIVSTTGLPSQMLPKTFSSQIPGSKETFKDNHVESMEVPKVHPLESSPNEQMSAKVENRKNDNGNINGAESLQYLALLCSETSLRLYYMSSLLKGIRSPSLKVRLNKPCCWASTFHTPSDRVGLVLLYRTGQIEIRCIPDLCILKSIPLDSFLTWQQDPDVSLLRTISCTANGQIALIDHSREFLLLSTLNEKHDIRLPIFSQSSCLEDVAAVINNTTATGSKMKKKKKFLGRLSKEGKSGILKDSDKEDEQMTSPNIVELDQLFTTSSTPLHSYQSDDDDHSDHSSIHEVRSGSLDIDDIDIEDEISDKIMSRNPNRRNLMSKVKRGFKGKKKLKKPHTSNETMQNIDASPVGRARTLDEIKASYGQGHENATRGASIIRDKLLLQRQKLQAIDKKTAEMQGGAENFHRLAEDLVKAIEDKNKRKFF